MHGNARTHAKSGTCVGVVFYSVGVTATIRPSKFTTLSLEQSSELYS